MIILIVKDSMWPIKTNYKHMKSSMTNTSHSGMIIKHARFHMAAEKQIINR
jgi:hypothetical protein